MSGAWDCPAPSAAPPGVSHSHCHIWCVSSAMLVTDSKHTQAPRTSEGRPRAPCALLLTAAVSQGWENGRQEERATACFSEQPRPRDSSTADTELGEPLIPGPHSLEWSTTQSFWAGAECRKMGEGQWGLLLGAHSPLGFRWPLCWGSRGRMLLSGW